MNPFAIYASPWHSPRLIAWPLIKLKVAATKLTVNDAEDPSPVFDPGSNGTENMGCRSRFIGK
jgi:hypothetical protein